MIFLPKEINNIIYDYKNIFENIEKKKKIIKEINDIKKYYLYSYNSPNKVYLMYVLNNYIIYSKEINNLSSYLYDPSSLIKIENRNYNIYISYQDILSKIHTFFVKNIEKKIYKFPLRIDWICLDSNLKQIYDKKIINELIEYIFYY